MKDELLYDLVLVLVVMLVIWLLNSVFGNLLVSAFVCFLLILGCSFLVRYLKQKGVVE